MEGFSKDYVRIMEEILKDPVTINVGTNFFDSLDCVVL